MLLADCERCGGTGRVPAYVPLIPQIESKSCPDCFPDHKLCVCCGVSSAGNDCATCDERRATVAARAERSAR